MTTWKITYVIESGKSDEIVCSSKYEAIVYYLLTKWQWGVTELKIWENDVEYTEEINENTLKNMELEYF